MNFPCPVCNGFESLNSVCQKCSQSLDDLGPQFSFLGPYSPYRDIDDQKLSNDIPDLLYKQCIHIGYCTQCQSNERVTVGEIPSQMS